MECKFTLKTDFINFTKNSLNKEMYSISHLLDQREVYRTQSMSGSKPNLGKSCESKQGKWENSTTLTFFSYKGRPEMLMEALSTSRKLFRKLSFFVFRFSLIKGLVCNVEAKPSSNAEKHKQKMVGRSHKNIVLL